MASSKDIDNLNFLHESSIEKAIANLESLLDENNFQEISALRLWIQKMMID